MSDRGSDNIHLGLQIKSAGEEGVGGISISSRPVTSVLKTQLIIIIFFHDVCVSEMCNFLLLCSTSLYLNE